MLGMSATKWKRVKARIAILILYLVFLLALVGALYAGTTMLGSNEAREEADRELHPPTIDGAVGDVEARRSSFCDGKGRSENGLLGSARSWARLVMC